MRLLTVMKPALRPTAWTIAAVVASVLLSGCARRSAATRQDCANPDEQLASVLQPYEQLRAAGCTPECDRLVRAIERLSLVCSGHKATLMANAVIAYDDHRPASAQQLLDIILGQPGTHPDAAALRARIAIEEGNLPFARRLLEQQINLTPDHAGLHETYGAALYLARQLPEAERALTLAGVLGAPRWRIQYHLGLIREAEARFDEAIRHYTESLAGRPGWLPAQSRLNALRATRPSP